MVLMLHDMDSSSLMPYENISGAPPNISFVFFIVYNASVPHLKRILICLQFEKQGA